MLLFLFDSILSGVSFLGIERLGLKSVQIWKVFLNLSIPKILYWIVSNLLLSLFYYIRDYCNYDIDNEKDNESISYLLYREMSGILRNE